MRVLGGWELGYWGLGTGILGNWGTGVLGTGVRMQEAGMCAYCGSNPNHNRHNRTQ